MKGKEVLDNGFVVNWDRKEIKIPLRDIWKDIVDWALASTDKLDILRKYSFHLKKDKHGKSYCAAQNGTSMHELVFGRKARKGYKLDHENRIPLDCRTCNIREVTDSQNAHNRSKQEGTTSQYIGVSYCKKKCKWQSIIICKGERYNLGAYEEEYDAAYIHDIWAIFLYREFARCNILKDGTPIISSELQNDILTNGIPKGYERKQKKTVLPKNIKCIPYNGYKYRISKKIDDKRIRKYAKTYKDALITLEEMIISAMEKQEINHNSRKIFRNNNGIPYIPVNNNGKVLHFLVNKRVWHDLMKITWSASVCENYAHGKDENGIDSKLHNYIYTHYIGEIKEGYTVDHIESTHQRDVRIENLRLMTKSGQSHNTQHPRVIKFPTGVYINKGKFGVICHRKYGGRFKTIEEAAEKYNKMAILIHGKNAKLNNMTTTGTTAKIFFNNLITLDYLKKISTVIELQEVLRFRKDWKDTLRIGYDSINRKTLKYYLSIVLEHAKNNMEQEYISDKEDDTGEEEEDITQEEEDISDEDENNEITDGEENYYIEPIAKEECEDYGLENYSGDESSEEIKNNYIGELEDKNYSFKYLKELRVINKLKEEAIDEVEDESEDESGGDLEDNVEDVEIVDDKNYYSSRYIKELKANSKLADVYTNREDWRKKANLSVEDNVKVLKGIMFKNENIGKGILEKEYMHEITTFQILKELATIFAIEDEEIKGKIFYPIQYSDNYILNMKQTKLKEFFNSRLKKDEANSINNQNIDEYRQIALDIYIDEFEKFQEKSMKEYLASINPIKEVILPKMLPPIQQGIKLKILPPVKREIKLKVIPPAKLKIIG
jgi:hypothetical protein